VDSAPDRTGYPRAVRYVRLIAGWALLVVGISLLPLPGPGAALLLLGLAVLEPEAAWARRLRERLLALFRRRRQVPVPARDGLRGP
jgi:uncharacterized protein (TIGR02611 family)